MQTNLLELLQDKNKRHMLCSQSLYLFWLYYFREYFTHKSPEFHKERCKITQSLWEYQNPRFLVNCEFRWSAKTSWAKIDFTKKICYKEREMMMYGSYEKGIAENALLDVAIQLQTNQRIIDDFWQLFYNTDTSVKKSQKQGISNFLTSNWVRVQAITTQQSIRWFIFNGIRPDHIVYDDFENKITKKSNKRTREVIEHFDEMLTAISVYGTVIFCCNKISDTWSVAWLYNKAEWNKEWVIYEKAVIEWGKITWKEKYTMTDEESDSINKAVIDKRKRMQSLESLKRTLNKDGRKVFEQEMLNQPIVDGDRLFDINTIDRLIEEAKEYEFESDWNWKIWEEFDPFCEYVIWADVSEWFGLDSSTIEVINATTWEQVAEYESNLSSPWELAKELIQASQNYWWAWVTPERNNIGTAVIEVLKEMWYSHILTTQKLLWKTQWSSTQRYWWLTTWASKAKMLFDLQSDVYNWLIKIKSIALLREMRSFSNSDLRVVSFDDEVSNHFDRVMGFAIANQMKNYIGEFAIEKKKISIWENAMWTTFEPKFKNGKFKINFK